MTDQCKHCSFIGNLAECLKADCYQHENWYAKKQQERISKLEGFLSLAIHEAEGWYDECRGRELSEDSKVILKAKQMLEAMK